MVAPISSSRVDQETLLSSIFTSRKKFIGFKNIFIFIASSTHRKVRLRAGAAGVEPAVTVLETAGLPLTDAPNQKNKF